jgi:catechol 2,3-dioxygenase-like lactoylglutathione lyase family enzyme
MREQFSQLLELHEHGVLDRRQLLGALVAVAAGATPGLARDDEPRARSLNHVTLSVADVQRSREFYERLLGVRARAEQQRSAVLPVGNGFLVLDSYAGDKPAAHPRGIDHFCVGIDHYEPKTTASDLRKLFPDATVTLEYGTQVYIRDPDGAMVQFSAADYAPR